MTSSNNIYASQSIIDKLSSKHAVDMREVEQCFENRSAGLLIDTREKHVSSPPTMWFVSETNHGRRLKVVFVHDHGKNIIKSAYEANDEELRIYNKYAPPL